MRYYSYKEFLVDVNELAKDVKSSFQPDAIISVVRGGMTLGHFLAEALDMRNLYSLNSIHYEETHKLDTIKIFNLPDLFNAKKVLIVDDIIDSGETMIEIKRILNEKYPNIIMQVATIFYKEGALLHPDFSAREATEWVEFFWDFQIDNYKK